MHALYFVRYIYFFFVVFFFVKKKKKKKKKQKKIPFRCFSFRRSAVPCSVVPRITNNRWKKDYMYFARVVKPAFGLDDASDQSLSQFSPHLLE